MSKNVHDIFRYQHQHHSHAIFNSYPLKIFFFVDVIHRYTEKFARQCVYNEREYHHHFLIHHEVSFPCVCLYAWVASMPYHCKDNFQKLKKAPQRPDNMGVVLYWYHSALLFIHTYILSIRISRMYVCMCRFSPVIIYEMCVYQTFTHTHIFCENEWMGT